MNLGWSVSLVVVGVAILVAAANAFAIQPSITLDQRAIANKPGITFEMDKKPWKEVLTWLVEKYDLPLLVASGCPKGTFTFIGPKGSFYSLSRIVEIINEALLARELVIIRCERCLMLVAVSEASSRPAP
jgi:hypothetical protein